MFFLTNKNVYNITTLWHYTNVSIIIIITIIIKLCSENKES